MHILQLRLIDSSELPPTLLTINMPTVNAEKPDPVTVSTKSTVTEERVPMLDCDEQILKPGVARANLAPSIEVRHGSVEHAKKVGDYVCSSYKHQSCGTDLTFPTECAPTTRSLLGPEWRRGDYPHRYLHRLPRFGFQYTLLSSICSDHQLELLLSDTSGTLMVTWSVFQTLCGRHPQGKGNISPRCCLNKLLTPGQHGSDSGVIDPEGRFVPQNFENLFSKYDKTGSGSLSLREMFNMLQGHRCAADPFGVSDSPMALKLLYAYWSC
jgi:hypothetical protein